MFDKQFSPQELKVQLMMVCLKVFSSVGLAFVLGVGIGATLGSPVSYAESHAEESSGPIINFSTRFLPTVSEHGMVVAADSLAADAGVQMLRNGGNAVDAAVATAFALAVTYPSAGNLAGGGFMLLDINGKRKFIDYREAAPLAASRDMYLNKTGEVDKRKLVQSHLSAGVPGTVAGLTYALNTYGTMSLKEVMKPAIRLAQKGFIVNYALSSSIKRRNSYSPWQDAEAKRIYLKNNGDFLQPGDHFKQTDLAWTLKQIARHGKKAFYQGKIAQRLVQDMHNNAGLITLQDLKAYKVLERAPIEGRFKDFEIVSAPPPSSGGVHIVQMLNIIENADLADLGHNSAAYIHLLAEAMKLAYADRSKYLGDPDFFNVPIAQLTSKAYASKLYKSINPTLAKPSSDILPGAELPAESTETTHFSVVDKHGNAVSNTYTLNFSFGSGIVVPGTGMLLNNEMADFSAKPGHANPFGLVGGVANAIDAEKRPLSSMSPTIAYKDGKPWLVTGSPGGSLIITTVLQMLLNNMVFDFNVASAAAAPRFHHQWLPDSLRIEEGISIDTQRLLERLGHPVNTMARTMGRTQSIRIGDGFYSGEGYLYGATDTRRPQGAVAGY